MNKILPVDNLTFWIFFGFWPLWLVWELVLLKMRGANPNVDLISMVARDRTYQMASLAFVWGSLAAHFFANWKVLPPWYGTTSAVTFWVLIAVALLWDFQLWHRPYETLPLVLKYVRFPGTMLFLGLLNGTLLFPQRGPPSLPL